ncbi:hypothetical protein CHE29_06450 [Salmonella enterica]|nr:hypothetical protein CHE29_06450 [Salmonella enterica]
MFKLPLSVLNQLNNMLQNYIVIIQVISNWQDPNIEIYYNNELLDYENKVNRGISYPQNANLDLSLYLRDFHYSVLLV